MALGARAQTVSEPDGGAGASSGLNGLKGPEPPEDHVSEGATHRRRVRGGNAMDRAG
jgi:hypothetical protein